MLAISRAMFAAAAVLMIATVARAALSAETIPARRVAAIADAAQELPDGPGKAELTKICSGCHDLMFTVSTRETEEGWTRIVNEMRSKGADGSDEDFGKVIAYLAKYMGKK